MLWDLWRARRRSALQTNCPHVRQSKWHKQSLAGGMVWAHVESRQAKKKKGHTANGNRWFASGSTQRAATHFGVNVCVPGGPSISQMCRAGYRLIPLCSCPMSLSATRPNLFAKCQMPNANCKFKFIFVVSRTRTRTRTRTCIEYWQSLSKCAPGWKIAQQQNEEAEPNKRKQGRARLQLTDGH